MKDLETRTFALDSNDEPIKCKADLHEDLACKNGIYDIHYAINLLNQIEDRCEKGRFSAHDLRFTLQHSCKTLRLKLEMERDFNQDTRVKTYRCDNCQEMYFVPANMKGECPHCLNERPKRIFKF